MRLVICESAAIIPLVVELRGVVLISIVHFGLLLSCRIVTQFSIVPPIRRPSFYATTIQFYLGASRTWYNRHLRHKLTYDDTCSILNLLATAMPSTFLLECLVGITLFGAAIFDCAT